jgi:hypothetical protein
MLPAQSPPPPPRPLVGAAGVAKGGGASRTGLWLVGGAVALLVLALVVGGLAARRWVAAKQLAKTEQQLAATTEPQGVKPAADAVTPADSPPVENTPPTQPNQPDPGERFEQKPPVSPPVPESQTKPIAPRPEPANEPVSTTPTKPAPRPAPPQAEPEPAPEEPVEDVAEPVIDRPAIDPRIDRMMVTGMALSFVVEPPEAIVKIDGRVIGQAGTWNAKKRDGRAYDLPESGDHIVRITHEGRVWTIRVSASEGAPSPTLVTADLRAPSAKGKKRRLGERP